MPSMMTLKYLGDMFFISEHYSRLFEDLAAFSSPLTTVLFGINCGEQQVHGQWPFIFLPLQGWGFIIMERHKEEEPVFLCGCLWKEGHRY